MKYSRRCPKCGSTDLVYIPGGSKVYSAIFTGDLGAVPIQKYLCCNCGFIEFWLDKEEYIKTVKEKYGK